MADGWNGERQIGEKLSDIEPKHIERYNFATKYCTGMKVFDCASGCGYGTNLLATVANRVLGMDYSTEAYRYAEKHWDADNIEFTCHDITRLSPGLVIDQWGMFDVVVSLETIEHLEPPIEDMIKKFADLTRKYLIISFPENEPCKSKGRFHHHCEIKGDDVIKHIESLGFEIVEDWLQPRRFIADYHILVAKRKETVVE